MALATALRQFLAAGLVILSEAFFDGTIVPVAIIIFSYAFIATACFIVLQYAPSKTQVTESPFQTQI